MYLKRPYSLTTTTTQVEGFFFENIYFPRDFTYFVLSPAFVAGFEENGDYRSLDYLTVRVIFVHCLVCLAKSTIITYHVSGRSIQITVPFTFLSDLALFYFT